MITTYYWRGKKNFGDLLTPYLLGRYAKLSSMWAPPEDAQLIMTGSILEHMPMNWQGVIAGVGKLHESSHLHLSNADIFILRGPLTAKGFKGDYVLGDPALLADELVGNQDKLYNLGIVPHWTDKVLEHDKRFLQYNPKIIRVDDDPLEVIRQIGQCRKIISSSLHGIILADAFGIPRRIEMAPRMLSHAHQEGGLFKWRDYSASLGMELEIGLTQEPDRNVVMEKQHELFDAMDEIKAFFA